MTPEEQEKEILIEDLLLITDRLVGQAIEGERKGKRYRLLILVIMLFSSLKMIGITLKYLPLFDKNISQDLASSWMIETTPFLFLMGLGILNIQLISYHFSSSRAIDRFINKARDKTQREIRLNLINAALERKLTEEEVKNENV